MLAATVRASGDVQSQVLLKTGQPLVQFFDQPPGVRLRLCDCQLAEFRSRACDHTTREWRSRDRQPGERQPVREHGDILAGNIDDQQVLHVCCSQLSARVLIRHLSCNSQLLGTYSAPQDRNSHAVIPALLLLVNTHVIAIDVVRNIFRDGGSQLESEAAMQFLEEALICPAVLQKQELKAGAFAAFAEYVAVAKDPGNSLEHGQHLVRQNERVQATGQMRIGREAAPNAQREPDFITMLSRMPHRGQANIVDLRIRAPYFATGDADFEFAWQVVELCIANELPIRLHHQWRSVVEFVGINSGQGAPGDVARVVPTRTHGGETASPQTLQHMRQIFDPHPMELNVLPHGKVGAAARVFLCYFGDRSDLVRQQYSVGDADANHEVPNGFALAASSADRTCAIALCIHTPEPEVGAQPFRRNRLKAIPGKQADLIKALPGILLPFKAFDPLRLRLLDLLCHSPPPRLSSKRKNPRVRCL